MKHLKILGFAVMATAALLPFTGSASATVFTSPSGTEYTGTLTMTATSSLLMQGSVFDNTCTQSTMSSTVATNTTVASGGIQTLNFSSCDSTVKVLTNGSLEVNGSGEVITKDSRVTYERFGISCIYGGGTGTKIGTLTPGTTAFLNVSAKLPKQTGSSAFCSATNEWFGQYTVTTPDTLLLN